MKKDHTSRAFSLVFGLLVLFTGATVAWSAVQDEGLDIRWEPFWHGTSWIYDGTVIEAKKIAENFEWLYNKTVKTDSMPQCDGDDQALQWDGEKFICKTIKVSGKSCKHYTATNRNSPYTPAGRITGYPPRFPGRGGASIPTTFIEPTGPYGRVNNLYGLVPKTYADKEIWTIEHDFGNAPWSIGGGCYTYQSGEVVTFQCIDGTVKVVHIDPIKSEYCDDRSCFTAESLVTMADGSKKRIEDIVVGDQVLGQDGQINTVKGIERVPLAGRKLFSINGKKAFVTAEHPFLTTDGWKAISPAALLKEEPSLAATLKPTTLSVGDVLITTKGTETITSIEAREAQEQTVYNLILDGNHTYFVNDYLVHNKLGEN